MTPFTVLSGIAAPLPLANVDTDAIMPKQYLKTIKRTGLGKYVFDDMRANPDFVLNTAPYTRASILITGANFGCGSSREHAPWGLLDFGIRCVIATSFADIFASNCVKNGILCVTLHPDAVARLTALATAPATSQLTVDLGRQVIVTRDGVEQPFEIEPSRKHLLMEGLDDIGLTLQHADTITKFEVARIWREPWHINGSLSHD